MRGVGWGVSSWWRRPGLPLVIGTNVNACVGDVQMELLDKYEALKKTGQLDRCVTGAHNSNPRTPTKQAGHRLATMRGWA